jgi:ribosomal protein S12 methylthiotransferase accessory factor
MGGAGTGKGDIDAIGTDGTLSHLLAPFNITRFGDLTGLDTIGIPVWFAVRPNARSLSVSQGKGLTHAQARISAIMEGVEGAVAEQTRQIIARFGTPGEMEEGGCRLVPLEAIDRVRAETFDERRQRAWVRGLDHTAGEVVYAPYELVGLDMRADAPWDYAAFKVASGGLAAGPSFEFAALNAVLELIEQDAACRNRALGVNGFSRQLIWRPGINPALDEAVGRVCAAGLEPRFFEIGDKVDLPVVCAVIARPVLDAQGMGERLSGGYACRFDAVEAAFAALLEAVQSRLTNIAGSRDDIDPLEYTAGAGLLPPISPNATSLIVHFPAFFEHTCRGRLERALAMLKAAGYHDAFFFDLPGPVDGIHVVRALIPGLKAFIEDAPSAAEPIDPAEDGAHSVPMCGSLS